MAIISPNEREKVAARHTDPEFVGYLKKRLASARHHMSYAKEDWLLRQYQGRVQELQELLELVTGRKEDSQ